MDPASMTVDELIAASADLDDRAGGLFDRLARITARARDNGIEVVVNLDGMLVGLELTAEALRLGAGRLAAEIFRLTQQAAGTALVEGIETLEPIAGEELMSLIDLGEPADPPAAPAEDPDFSAIQSWALPH
jgi:hypothetical protein